MARSRAEASERLSEVEGALLRRVQERPYPLLAMAAMAGYVAGGGLFSSVTRPLARAALGILLVPGVRERLRGLGGDLRAAEAAGTV